MSNRVFLISEDVLKSETIINDNVGSEYIGPAIETSQDIYLQQLIGTELLDSLYEQISKGDIKEQYKILLDDHITNFLKFKVLAEIVIPLSFKYRNAGIVQTGGDYFTNSTLKDAQAVQSHYEMRATFYAERMSKYLSANSDKFPEYRSTRDSSDMMADSDSYKTNWVI